MPEPSQNFQNHTRVDAVYMGFLFPGAIILLGASIYALVRQPDWMAGLRVFGVLWLIVLMFKTRLYALKVQDRVIRLEERLRLAQLLPAATNARIGELTEAQLIALRFASDGEVAGLVEQTLHGKLDPKQIKQAVKVWRADYWRV
jgi:uncharacterized membrane protein YesL